MAEGLEDRLLAVPIVAARGIPTHVQHELEQLLHGRPVPLAGLDEAGPGGVVVGSGHRAPVVPFTETAPGNGAAPRLAVEDRGPDGTGAVVARLVVDRRATHDT